MSYSWLSGGFVCALLAARAFGDVGLEWRPVAAVSELGQNVEIALYAVPSTGLNELVAGIDAVVSWDASRLQFVSAIDPCATRPCPPNSYQWLQANFPDDDTLDALNTDLTDGDFFYQALARLGRDNAAVVEPQGLWVVTFKFLVLVPGSAQVRLETQLGKFTRTRVLSGEFTGEEITGTLGPHAVITVSTCPTPTMIPLGSRYLEVSPGATAGESALLITADVDDSAVACLAAYVQPTGLLGPLPAFQSVASWGSPKVRGRQIRPGTTYYIQRICGTAEESALSTPVAATTWKWGDADGDGDAAIDDITRVVDAANGIFGTTTLEQVDIAPCLPDRVVNPQDIAAVLDAVELQPFPCEPPCISYTLGIMQEFVDCLAGPNLTLELGCNSFDLNLDSDCDLQDFSALQRIFSAE